MVPNRIFSFPITFMLGELDYYDYDHRSYDTYKFGIVLPLVV